MNKELLRIKSSNLSDLDSSKKCVKCSKENKKNQHRLDPLLFPIVYFNSKTISDFCLPRKYTSTHNDETKQIFLSIGPKYDKNLLDSEEVRVVQSQVVGKWVRKDRSHQDERNHQYYILLKVIVSSEQNPQAEFRNYVFCNELGPVLEGIALAETCLLKEKSWFKNTEILVHFKSIDKTYDRIENWGKLGYWAC